MMLLFLLCSYSTLVHAEKFHGFGAQGVHALFGDGLQEHHAERTRRPALPVRTVYLFFYIYCMFRKVFSKSKNPPHLMRVVSFSCLDSIKSVYFPSLS